MKRDEHLYLEFGTRNKGLEKSKTTGRTVPKRGDVSRGLSKWSTSAVNFGGTSKGIRNEGGKK